MSERELCDRCQHMVEVDETTGDAFVGDSGSMCNHDDCPFLQQTTREDSVMPVDVFMNGYHEVGLDYGSDLYDSDEES